MLAPLLGSTGRFSRSNLFNGSFASARLARRPERVRSSLRIKSAASCSSVVVEGTMWDPGAVVGPGFGVGIPSSNPGEWLVGWESGSSARTETTFVDLRKYSCRKTQSLNTASPGRSCSAAFPLLPFSEVPVDEHSLNRFTNLSGKVTVRDKERK